MSALIERDPPLRWTADLLRRIGLDGPGLVIAVPVVWLLVFFLIPFLVVAKISVSEAAIARPPYLPFMILPLYANLVKLDENLLEASSDLGGRPLVTFLHVTLPLSMPGIIAGFMLVFIPAIGEFVIPELLGGPDTLMIGRVLWNEFFSNRDWPVASAVAIAMLVVLVVPIMLLRLAQVRVEEE